MEGEENHAKITGQDWLSHYELWQTSGLNKAEYCRCNNLSKDNFYYWSNRFSKMVSGNKSVAGNDFISVLSRDESKKSNELMQTELVLPNETLPNQINKPIKNPTLRWIFQIMEGISIVNFYEKNMRNPIKTMIANLDDLRIKIIKLFGLSAQKIYGIT